MTEQDKQQPTSLADGLANWTPPWARAAAPTEEPAEAVDDATPEDAEEAAPSEPDLAADLRPASASDEAPDVPAEVASSEPKTPLDPPSLGEPATEQPEASQLADPVAAEPDDDAQSGDSEPADDEGDVPDASADDTAEADEPEAAPGEPADLRGALEAILLVVDEPVTEVVLAQILEVPTETVGTTLRELADEYTETRRGFDLRRAAGGWRLYTRTEFAPYVERFVLDGQQVRLTQAALETLAVVAYKQPVTRPRISAIRGVNCDGVIRTLLTRGLIEECGAEPDSGAHLYRTTALFCEKLGIDSVDDLPPLAPFLPDDLPLDLTDVIDSERAQMRGGSTPKPSEPAAEPDVSDATDDAAHD